MNDNRLQVLQMLAAGQISAEEAEGLIAALDRPAAPPRAAGPTLNPRYLRILVQDTESGATGPTNVNIRVPFQLLRAGVRLTSLLPGGAKDQINDALRRSGVPIDVTQLKPEELEELVLHLADVTIDVDEKDTKVRIFAE
jgi:SHOCT-like protein